MVLKQALCKPCNIFIQLLHSGHVRAALHSSAALSANFCLVLYVVCSLH